MTHGTRHTAHDTDTRLRCLFLCVICGGAVVLCGVFCCLVLGSVCVLCYCAVFCVIARCMLCGMFRWCIKSRTRRPMMVCHFTLSLHLVTSPCHFTTAQQSTAHRLQTRPAQSTQTTETHSTPQTTQTTRHGTTPHRPHSNWAWCWGEL